ncbi:MAG: NAD(P)-dependent alcohol dehydrogenase [Acidobacteriia bacterium]|nr:NAD(P)-dependent alcohol dehydrogenase [Terriglobia bacterium]
MKAAVYSRYGPPDVLQIKDVEKPVPKDNEVLIRVRAASVNPLDEGLLKGGGRLVTGLLKPKATRLGVDVAGQVEAVGRDVTQFRPGDDVFGACISDPQASALRVWIPRGAFAQYVCAHQSALVMKPDNATFEQAASAPVAAFTALQGLRDKGRIQPGQKVLINGAAGGVGTLAVQIAKSFGAEVNGVCSTRNVEMVRSIGANHVIDYTREDFTKGGQRYDLILDCIGNHSLSACRRVLNPRGICVMVGERSGRGMIGILARLIAALVLSWFVTQKMVTFLARPIKEDLTVMRELMAAGKVTPVIDRCYSLSEVREAIRYLGEGHARGKVVIVLESNHKT